MSIAIDNIQEIISAITASVAVAVAFASIAGALKSGVFKKIRLGSLEFEASDKDYVLFKEGLASREEKSKTEVPFEIEQLANYYSQILSQSKISFWFSLVFASLGFATIVIAAFLYTDSNGTATIAQFIAGLIMDAVSGLFFVQSRNAQKSMGDFFDKLRSDRLHMESRSLSESIESAKARDALRLHLALHYSGVGESDSIAKHITEKCLSANSI
ncbi:hypothetical protein ACE34P_001863 [Vibrio fluvialis]